MAGKIGEIVCETIARIPWNKVLIHFSLYMKFRKHNTAVRTPYTAQWKYQKK
jgi:hypothetical protein